MLTFFMALLSKITEAVPARTVVAAVALCAASYGGWFAHGLYSQASLSEQLTKAQEQMRQAVQRAIDEAERVRQIDMEIVEDHTDVQAVIREVEREVIVEVIKYVSNDSSCNLTVGAVGLLNDARRAAAGGDAVSGTAGFTDEESQAASTTTQQDSVTAHKACAIEYERLRNQHNALISWLEAQRGM